VRVTNSEIITATKQWLQEIVIGLDLCPFAKHALGSIEFSLSEAPDEQHLLADLEQACLLLQNDSRVETLLLIHPNVLQDFDAYNQFLSYADSLLDAMQLEGVIQVASFHPEYQFAETDFESAENYTNRSPYPMLHLLREASVELAIDSYPDVDAIPQRNIGTMQHLGSKNLKSKLLALQTVSKS
jgi:hypothetical protein